MNRLIASLTLAILTGTLVGCAVPRGTIVAYNAVKLRDKAAVAQRTFTTE